MEVGSFCLVSLFSAQICGGVEAADVCAVVCVRLAESALRGFLEVETRRWIWQVGIVSLICFAVKRWRGCLALLELFAVCFLLF